MLRCDVEHLTCVCLTALTCGRPRIVNDLYKDLRAGRSCTSACRLLHDALHHTRARTVHLDGQVWGAVAVPRARKIAALARLIRYAGGR